MLEFHERDNAKAFATARFKVAQQVLDALHRGGVADRQLQAARSALFSISKEQFVEFVSGQYSVVLDVMVSGGDRAEAARLILCALGVVAA